MSPQDHTPSPFARMISWIDGKCRAASQNGEWWKVVVAVNDELVNVEDLAKVALSHPTPATAVIGLGKVEGENVEMAAVKLQNNEWHAMLPHHARGIVGGSTTPGYELVLKAWHEIFPESPYDRILDEEDAHELPAEVNISKFEQMLDWLKVEVIQPGVIIHIAVRVQVDEEHYTNLHARIEDPAHTDPVISNLKTVSNMLGAELLILTPRKKGAKTHKAAMALYAAEEGEWAGLSVEMIRESEDVFMAPSYFDTTKFRWVDWGKAYPHSPAMPADAS